MKCPHCGGVYIPTSDAEVEDDLDFLSKSLMPGVVRKRAPRIKSAALIQDFESFWKIYPKKTGRGKAEESWKRLSPPLVAVLEALSWQTRQPNWTKDNGNFIPMPVTWLNQKRWLDEPTAPVQRVSIYKTLVPRGTR